MTTRPIRLQRKRTKGFRLPTNTVCVDRSTKWGNPFRIGEHWRHGACRIDTGNVAFNTQLLKAFGDRKLTREDCVLAYRILLNYAGLPQGSDHHWPEPGELKGKNLACFCPPDEPCHADVLLEMANP
jgi:hypothetical protein